MVRNLTDQGVEERVLSVDGPVGLAFLDYDSVPCRHFRPELEAVAEQLEEKVVFYRTNVTENPSITEALGVEAIPTLVIFREGKELARYEGPYSREALGDRIAQLLAGQKPTL